MTTPTYTLPPLPYPYNALEPCISEQIMRLHHDKHHATYITNLNAGLATKSTNPEALEIDAKIAFNAGGHINHTLFWESLTPPNSARTQQQSAAPQTTAALIERWGSVEAFKETFQASLLGIRGSGWGWLVCAVESGRLEIVTTKDQEVVSGECKPLLGIDMWEHAYYLQYLNDKAGYVRGIWGVVNWEEVERRYERGLEEVYGGLCTLKAML